MVVDGQSEVTIRNDRDHDCCSLRTAWRSATSSPSLSSGSGESGVDETCRHQHSQLQFRAHLFVCQPRRVPRVARRAAVARRRSFWRPIATSTAASTSQTQKLSFCMIISHNCSMSTPPTRSCRRTRPTPRDSRAASSPHDRHQHSPDVRSRPTAPAPPSSRVVRAK